MHQAKNLTPPTDPPSPHLKLRRPSVDDADVTVDALYINGDEVHVAPGTALPRRCVKCGDAMDTLPVRTLRGTIQYRLCREHAVSTVANVLAGLGLILLGAAAVGSKLVGDPIVGNRLMVLCVVLAAAGAAWVYRTLPVTTCKAVNDRYPIRGLHPDVIDDLRRSSRL